MTVPYTSYQALVLQSVIEMLAASTTFQGILGVATSTLAKGRIVESWGGSPARAGRAAIPQAVAVNNVAFNLTPPWAEVHIGELPSTSIGIGVWAHDGSAMIVLVLPRQITGEQPPESFRRARNQVDAVRADLEAMFGTTINGVAALARGAIEVTGPGMPDEVSADGDSFEGRLTISFEG